MHVKLIVADWDACGHYRMAWPAQAVEALTSVQTVVTDELPKLRRGREVVGIVDPEADVVVLQRPLTRVIADTVPFLQGWDAAVVIELDDDFVGLHPDHPTRHAFSEDCNPLHLQRACDAADLVTAPTQALLNRYATHGRGMLVPNCLPRSVFNDSDAPTRANIIGWSGASHSHPGDLETVGPAIANLLDRMPAVDLHVIGDSEDVTARLGLHRPAWASGWQPLGAYFQALHNVTVAIIPLQDSLFNDAKSAISGLVWAAAGVPFVASPTAEYQALFEEGAGMLAYSPSGWEECIELLLTDEDARNETCRAGRAVAEQHLLQNNAGRWVSAWEAAIANHRKLRPQRSRVRARPRAARPHSSDRV